MAREFHVGDRVLGLRLHREANHGHHRYVRATVTALDDDRVTIRYAEPFFNGYGTTTHEVTLHESRVIRPLHEP